MSASAARSTTTSAAGPVDEQVEGGAERRRRAGVELAAHGDDRGIDVEADRDRELVSGEHGSAAPGIGSEWFGTWPPSEHLRRRWIATPQDPSLSKALSILPVAACRTRRAANLRAEMGRAGPRGVPRPREQLLADRRRAVRFGHRRRDAAADRRPGGA